MSSKRTSNSAARNITWQKAYNSERGATYSTNMSSSETTVCITTGHAKPNISTVAHQSRIEHIKYKIKWPSNMLSADRAHDNSTSNTAATQEPATQQEQQEQQQHSSQKQHQTECTQLRA
jgi:hypothetical protein